MNNCFKVYYKWKLFAVVKTEADADWLLDVLAGPNGDWHGTYWEAAYVPNVGF